MLEMLFAAERHVVCHAVQERIRCSRGLSQPSDCRQQQPPLQRLRRQNGQEQREFQWTGAPLPQSSEFLRSLRQSAAGAAHPLWLLQSLRWRFSCFIVSELYEPPRAVWWRSRHNRRQACSVLRRLLGSRPGPSWRGCAPVQKCCSEGCALREASGRQ